MTDETTLVVGRLHGWQMCRLGFLENDQFFIIYAYLHYFHYIYLHITLHHKYLHVYITEADPGLWAVNAYGCYAEHDKK